MRPAFLLTPGSPRLNRFEGSRIAQLPQPELRDAGIFRCPGAADTPRSRLHRCRRRAHATHRDRERDTRGARVWCVKTRSGDGSRSVPPARSTSKSSASFATCDMNICEKRHRTGSSFRLRRFRKKETESKTATGGDEPLDLTAMVRMREGQPMTRSLDRFEDSLSEPRYVVASSGDSRASLCAHSNPPPPSVGACLAALTPFGAASAPFILRLHARSEVSGCPIDLTGRRERAAG